MVTEPALGRRTPLTAFSTVDLPAPFGPTMQVMPPRSTRKVHAAQDVEAAVAGDQALDLDHDADSPVFPAAEVTADGERHLVAEIGVDDGLVRADLGHRAAGDDLAVGHDVNPVGQAGKERDVMLDEQDADACGAQLADDAGEPLRQRGADARGRLVEQHKRRV